MKLIHVVCIVFLVLVVMLMALEKLGMASAELVNLSRTIQMGFALTHAGYQGASLTTASICSDDGYSSSGSGAKLYIPSRYQSKSPPPPPPRVKRKRFTQRERRHIASLQDFQCYLCNKGLSRHNLHHFDLDHKIPLSQGGTNEIHNVYALCVECHRDKTKWEASQRGYRSVWQGRQKVNI